MVDGDTFIGSFATDFATLTVKYKREHVTVPIGAERERLVATALLSRMVREDLALQVAQPRAETAKR